MELLRPDKRELKKVYVQIDSKYYELNHKAFYEDNINRKMVKLAISDSIEDYLSRCYMKLPIRNSNNANRNIIHVIFNKPRNIEDSFLLFYRFVECYYKRKNYRTNYLIKSLTESKNIYLEYFRDEELENVIQEIICLRNHYIHSGYYIHRGQLPIKFKDDKSKNYSAKADINWIYKRTKMLYYVTIDILYKQILNYDTYDYSKHF